MSHLNICDRNPIDDNPELMTRFTVMERMVLNKELANLNEVVFPIIKKRFSVKDPIDVLSLYLYQCVLWRAQELRWNSLFLISNNQYLTSLLIIRALMEISSVSYVISKSIDIYFNKPEEIETVNKFSKDLLKGTRLKKDFWKGVIEPIQIPNILDFFDIMVKDKFYPEARTHYEMLSEYCHPNHAVPRTLIIENMEYYHGTDKCSEKYRSVVGFQINCLFCAIRNIKKTSSSSIQMIQKSLGLQWDNSLG